MGRWRSPQSGKVVLMVAAVGKSTSSSAVLELWGREESGCLFAYQVKDRSGLANAIIHTKDGGGAARGRLKETISERGKGKRGGRVQEELGDGGHCDREVEGEEDGRDVVTLLKALCGVKRAVVVGQLLWKTIPRVLEPALYGVGEVRWELG
eukprot:6470407-Amphidinium_carterae.2